MGHRDLSRKIWTLLWGLVASVSWLVWVHHDHQGGVLFPESQSFFFNYLDPSRGFLEKIFDPRRNDWGQYQAREFSYAVDWLDAHLLAWTHRQGGFQFYSWVYFAALLGSVVLLVRLGVERFGKRFTPLALGLAAVLLTSPSPFLTVNFFRSSKILVTLGLTLIFWLLRNERVPRVGLLIVATLMTLCDRQGFFTVVALGGFFGLRWLFEREGRFFVVATMLGAAAALGTLYNFWIGPTLIQALNGYAPDFGYQRLQGIDNALHFTWKDNLREGMYTFLDQVVFLFGSRRVPWGFVILILLGFGIAWKNPRRKAHLALYAYALTATLFLHSMMVYRHQAILWAEVRRVYYWLPEVMLLILLAQWVLGRTLERNPRGRPWVLGLLGLIVWANAQALPQHGLHFRRGNMRHHFEEAPRLLECLKASEHDEARFEQGPFVVPPLERNCVLLRRQASGRNWLPGWAPVSAQANPF
jgi:hypothetical protein